MTPHTMSVSGWCSICGLNGQFIVSNQAVCCSGSPRASPPVSQMAEAIGRAYGHLGADRDVGSRSVGPVIDGPAHQYPDIHRDLCDGTTNWETLRQANNIMPPNATWAPNGEIIQLTVVPFVGMIGSLPPTKPFPAQAMKPQRQDNRFGANHYMHEVEK